MVDLYLEYRQVYTQYSRPFTDWLSFRYLMVLAFSTSTATCLFTFIHSFVYFQVLNGT